MPVFDLVAIAKFVIRFAFIVAIVAYVVSVSNVIGDAILSLWSIVSSSVDAFSSVANNSEGALSCTSYMLVELGITQSFASFSIAAISILVMWATTLVHMLLLRNVLSLKSYLLRLTK